MTTVDRMSEGYEPRWDIDEEVGRQGELYVASIIDAMKAGRVETKTDEVAGENGRVYIEFECQYGGEWQPSGIAKTESEVWCHVIRLEGAVICAPTEKVRDVARYCWKLGRKYQAETTRGSHPTKGVVIPIALFISLLANGIPGGD